MAVVFAAVRTGHGGGAVRIQPNAEAPAVHCDQMVKRTQQLKIQQTCQTALTARADMVHVTSRRRDEAAGGGTVLIPRDYGAPQVGWDRLSAGSGVQRQAD